MNPKHGPHDIALALEIERLAIAVGRQRELVYEPLLKELGDFSDCPGAWRIAIRAAEKRRRLWLVRLRDLNGSLVEPIQVQVTRLLEESASFSPIERLALELNLAAWIKVNYLQYLSQSQFNKNTKRAKRLDSALKYAKSELRQSEILREQARAFQQKMSHGNNGTAQQRSREGEPVYR